MNIILGPVLGYEWDSAEEKSYYTVLIRVDASPDTLFWDIDGQKLPLRKLSSFASGSIWRGECEMNPFSQAGRSVSYRVLAGNAVLSSPTGDKGWTFWLPGAQERPRIAYASCNGFSSARLAQNCEEPNAMWKKMEDEHRAKGDDRGPFSLLLMGGDQLYCDEVIAEPGMWANVWAFLSSKEQKKAKPTEQDLTTLRAFYRDHYVRRWSGEDKGARPIAMMRLLASIPSVMMWDDHDIVDGYGSHDDWRPEHAPFYRQLFYAAREYFALYQIRSSIYNRSLFKRGEATPSHFSLGLRFGPFTVLALDNRSGRSLDEVMSETNWNDVIAWTTKQAARPEAAEQTLLVMTSLPVVYRRFKFINGGIPGDWEFEDDVRDHWSVPAHEGERDKLVSYLFRWLKNSHKAGFSKVTLLSGDVHVGALGRLRNPEQNREVCQIVASGIVHPPPTKLEWAGLLAITTDNEYKIEIEGHGIVAEMMRPARANSKYLRTRNFAWLKPGDDGKLWVNWVCEDSKKYPEHAIV